MLFSSVVHLDNKQQQQQVGGGTSETSGDKHEQSGSRRNRGGGGGGASDGNVSVGDGCGETSKNSTDFSSHARDLANDGPQRPPPPMEGTPKGTVNDESVSGTIIGGDGSSGGGGANAQDMGETSSDSDGGDED